MRLRFSDEDEAFRAELLAWLNEHPPPFEEERADPRQSSADLRPWARRWQQSLFDAGYLVAFGKGRKQRLVPIGEQAIASMRDYVETVRPDFTRGRAVEALFLTHHGRGMTRQAPLCRRAKNASR